MLLLSPSLFHINPYSSGDVYRVLLSEGTHKRRCRVCWLRRSHVLYGIFCNIYNFRNKTKSLQVFLPCATHLKVEKDDIYQLGLYTTTSRFIGSVCWITMLISFPSSAADRNEWVKVLQETVRDHNVTNRVSMLQQSSAASEEKQGALELRGLRSKLYVVVSGDKVFLYKNNEVCISLSIDWALLQLLMHQKLLQMPTFHIFRDF